MTDRHTSRRIDGKQRSSLHYPSKPFRALKGLSLLLMLAGFAPAQNIVTTYVYDEVGNRTRVSDRISFADVRLTGFQPDIGLPGDRVTIFGRNLPPGNGSEFTVTFDGTTAAVISAAPNVLTVEVPPGVETGPLAVAQGGGDPVTLGIFRVQGIAIPPIRPFVSFDQTVAFSVDVIGAADSSVTWDVALPRTEQTDQSVGSIDLEGVYLPPDKADVLSAVLLLVRATSVEFPYLSAFTPVRLFGTTVLGGAPLRILLPVTGDAGSLPTDVTVRAEGALLAILLPATGDAVGVTSNVTVTAPGPAPRIVLPGTGDPPDVPHNIVFPAIGPPFVIVLPATGDAPDLPPADPPVVKIEFEKGP